MRNPMFFPDADPLSDRALSATVTVYDLRVTFSLYQSLLDLAGLPVHRWTIAWGEAYNDSVTTNPMALINLVKTVLSLCPNGTLDALRS